MTHRRMSTVTVTVVAGTCCAMLCLPGAQCQQGVDGAADSVCVANAQMLKEAAAVADPGQFTAAGCVLRQTPTRAAANSTSRRSVPHASQQWTGAQTLVETSHC